VRGGAFGVEKLNSAGADSETPKRPRMQPIHYIGLDLHKRKISEGGPPAVSKNEAVGHTEGFSAVRVCHPPMEATMFTGRVYDHLKLQEAAL
jgi:hypothetical protein